MSYPRTPSVIVTSAARPSRQRSRRLATSALLALGLIVGLLAGAAPTKTAEAAAVRRCNGKRATIVGSSRGETLRGTSRSDVIWAGAGNDKVAGRGGNDTICGGDGRDILTGGAGGDWINGQGGFDRVDAGDGSGDRCTAAEVRVKCERIPHFAMLAPGARLPSGATCRAQVRRAAEIRPDNTTYNRRIGTSRNERFPRVNGNFRGSTDRVLQWAACKWGIEERIVRAQAARESWWHQQAGGDLTSDQSSCHPLLRTSSGPCPESIGLLQVRYLYHLEAFEDANAIRSSAYNADYAYASWRACYEGEYTWLNNVERGRNYAKGDAWGCLGVWFAGRWHTPPANQYITNVRGYYNQRIWRTSSFKNDRL